MRAERIRQRESFLKRGVAELGWVCVGTEEARFPLRVFRAAVDVPYRPPGDLRHTYASRPLSAGEPPVKVAWEPPVKVAREMGHANAATTFRYCGRWIEEGEARKEGKEAGN